jgi:D-3-phosphoglycerate dehydrogenase
MAKHRVAFLTRSQKDVTLVEQGLAGLDCELDVHICNSDGETIEAIKGADVIIAHGVFMPRAVVEQIDTAKAIISPGHGFDHIDDRAATDKGVMVVNSAGFGSEEVAAHSIMLLLACAKKLLILHELARTGQWQNALVTIGEALPVIHGQVLGLVSLGNIARATARMAAAFGLHLIAYDPYVGPWIAREYNVELVPSLNELASRSDFVSIHTPSNEETRKLVGASFFKAMKPSAYFINTSRGGTTDEQALIQALRDGEIAGAGIDVYEEEPPPSDNPLFSLDNVIVTPHTAGNSVASLRASDVRMGEETARVLKGTWPMSLANPEVRAKLPMRPPATNR